MEALPCFEAAARRVSSIHADASVMPATFGLAKAAQDD
jgi:hypothetical protein